MKCPKCKGTKSMGFISTRRCDACDGTGDVYREGAPEPPPDPPNSGQLGPHLFTGKGHPLGVVSSPSIGDVYHRGTGHEYVMYIYTGACGWLPTQPPDIPPDAIILREPEQLTFTAEWGVDWETGKLLK